MMILCSKTTVLKALQLRIRLLQSIIVFVLLVNGVHAVDPRQEDDATIVTTVPRSKTWLQKTDYCAVTNSITLIEKVIERRCLFAVWLERLHIGSNAVEVTESSKLAEIRFEKDICGWLNSLSTYPDETLSTLKEEVNKETELIESLKRHGAWEYGDYVMQLTDEQRCRFLACLFHYKAKLYLRLEADSKKETKDKEIQRTR